jgi:exodeoxyribonuclease VII large subunit
MRGLGFAPDNGQQVLVRARIGLYAERGDYQLIVDYMEEAGAGALRRAFEALKARLGEEGLFEASRKLPVPSMPRCIGVITSPSGAAVHDVLTTLARRFPATPVILYPVPVQGDAAAPAIEAMLEKACARNECDVLILTRGGGSLEDLWAFNEERTARAIAACTIPVVSAVGHEVDFTIADFVSDHRAPTPTGAAELVSPDGAALGRQVSDLARRAQRTMLARINDERRYLRSTRARIIHPSARLADIAQRLDHLGLRMARAFANGQLARGAAHAGMRARLSAHHPERTLATTQVRFAQLSQRLRQAMRAQLNQSRARHAELARALRTIGPQATLERGYAIVTNDNGSRVIRSSGEVHTGDVLNARLASGALKLKVASSTTPDDATSLE